MNLSTSGLTRASFSSVVRWISIGLSLSSCSRPKERVTEVGSTAEGAIPASVGRGAYDAEPAVAMAREANGGRRTK